MSRSLNAFLLPVLMLFGIGSADKPPPKLAGHWSTSLSTDEQKRVNKAIERGVVYLKKTQLLSGTWGNGDLKVQAWPLGYSALAGLTLLESGVPARDSAVQKGAAFLRERESTLRRTYEISLAVLFLDRLGESTDRKLIQSLAIRLVAGQNSTGGWGYTCPVLEPEQEKNLIKELRQQKTAERVGQKGKKQLRPEGTGDNSNTQFAILALWAAGRHDLPVHLALARVEQRFRSSQQADGWTYWFNQKRPRYGSMTCVGLLALGVGRGLDFSTERKEEGTSQAKNKDKMILSGLRALGNYLKDPRDRVVAGVNGNWDAILGPKNARPRGKLNLYFLWSVERVGVLYNLQTIGGKDWYRWGVEYLLPAQEDDGSWFSEGYLGSSPTTDTCFALLFLHRANLAMDLSITINKLELIDEDKPKK